MPDNADKITLVGAGPVGTLLSVFLAKRGLQVEIYERRKDMRQEKISAGRSINLAISTRGIQALKKVGLDIEILKMAIPMKGRMIHLLNGELHFQPYSLNESDYINSISRAYLNKALMTYAEETGNVKIHFNKRVSHVDMKSQILNIIDETSHSEIKASFAKVVGTDGTASAVRESIMQACGAQAAESNLTSGYKELTLPAGPNNTFLLEKNALHIWPRGSFMLIALPNFDGSFTCTLFLAHKGPVSFEQLTSEDKVTAFFKEQFADVVPLFPDLAKMFFANPIGHMVTVKCQPWNFNGQALIMGDAAHGIVPFFGQGMNCGFEDCSVLAECLDNYKNSDWQELFSQFFQKRKTNTDAIADMAVENFVEMRDKVSDAQFLKEKAVEKIIQSKFPDKYLSRYALVTFSNVPYKLAMDAGIIENEILAELCRNINKPEEVNLQLAEKLIDSKLLPLLKPYKQVLSFAG